MCAAPIAGARVGHSAVACNKLLLTATAPAAMLGQRGLVAEARPREPRPGTAMATAQRRCAAPMPGGGLLAQAQRRSRQESSPAVPAAAWAKTEPPRRKAGGIGSCWGGELGLVVLLAGRSSSAIRRSAYRERAT